jgi:hypothetical protein
MKKNFLALIVMLCGLVGIANAQSVKLEGLKLPSTSSVAQAIAPKPALLAMVSSEAKPSVNTNDNAALVVVCYTYTLTTNQGFSTTYQWTNCDGTISRQHLDVGQSTSVCAQDGTVSGGPYTKGAVCH